MCHSSSDDMIGLEAIEHAAVRSWPALETARIDGWLARASSGGSVRANSVSALDYDGPDLEASIAAVVAFYRSRGLVPRFTITEVDRPTGLDQALVGLGWHRDGDHVTMGKHVAPAAKPAAAGLAVEVHDLPSPAWFAMYLQGLSGNRRAIAPRLVAGVPAPSAFFSCVREGQVIGSGLSVLDGPHASIQCMATLATARRSGAATAILDAIEAWASSRGARRLYLQTELGNAAAIGLYARQGFSVAGRYHTRELAA